MKKEITKIDLILKDKSTNKVEKKALLLEEINLEQIKINMAEKIIKESKIKINKYHRAYKKINPVGWSKYQM